MNKSYNMEIAATRSLDADPRPSGFSYSTLSQASDGEKAQGRVEAESTAALGGDCQNA
jgi:hypothetical protein